MQLEMGIGRSRERAGPEAFRRDRAHLSFLLSRSDFVTVAVGFSPRIKRAQQYCVAERRLNSPACVKSPSFVKRRSATQGYWSVQPWAKAHGYPHGLALRGGRGTVWLLKTEMRTGANPFLNNSGKPILFPLTPALSFGERGRGEGNGILAIPQASESDAASQEF